MLRVELPRGEHASLQRERHSPPVTVLIEGRVNPLAAAAHTPYPAVQDAIHLTKRSIVDEWYLYGLRVFDGLTLFFSPGSRLLSNPVVGWCHEATILGVHPCSRGRDSGAGLLRQRSGRATTPHERATLEAEIVRAGDCVGGERGAGNPLVRSFSAVDEDPPWRQVFSIARGRRSRQAIHR